MFNPDGYSDISGDNAFNVEWNDEDEVMELETWESLHLLPKGSYLVTYMNEEIKSVVEFECLTYEDFSIKYDLIGGQK